MVPKKLSEWNIEIIRKLLEKGILESEDFDFKESLPHKKSDDGKFRLRKTVAAFANSGGGFIIFGVKDARKLSVEERIIGIEKEFDFAQNFGNFPSECQPSVEWDFINPALNLENGDKVIHIVEILSTWKKPHAIQKDKAFIFPKRTNQGNSDMSYSELRSAFQEREFRRTKLSLLLAELNHINKLATGLLKIYDEAAKQQHLLKDKTIHWAWAIRYSTTVLDITLSDSYMFIAEKPELWTLLTEIRDSALHSNSACEAFSNIIYISITNRDVIVNQHYETVKSCAFNISEKYKEANPLITELIS